MLKVGRGIFTPRLWPTLITAVFLPVLIGLGAWQVQRLHWKEALIVTIGERVHEAPVAVPLSDKEDAEYRPARASGLFRHDLELFIFATQIGMGQGGYHVLTPLQLADGRYLLVDRGWIPFDRRQGSFARPEGQADVQGILRVPHGAGWLQPKNDPTKGEWYNIDLAAMAAADRLGGFLPYVLEADARPNEGGYPIGGQTRLTLPNDHFSYAVTWYSLAAILLIIYGLSGYRKGAGD